MAMPAGLNGVVLICLVRLAGIKPTTLGFGGQPKNCQLASFKRQLLDFTEYANEQRQTTSGDNAKNSSFFPPFLPEIQFSI